MSQRTERLDELLRQEIGAMLEREIADPRIGFATVTEVETSPDLRHARVWVSVIGGAAERDQTIAALERAMVFVRRELGHRLRLKRIPDLHVRLDDSIERGTRVLRLIDSIEAGETPDDAAVDTPRGESLPTPAPANRVVTGSEPAPAGPDAERDGFGAAAAEYAAAQAQERSAARKASAARAARRHAGDKRRGSR